MKVASMKNNLLLLVLSLLTFSVQAQNIKTESKPEIELKPRLKINLVQKMNTENFTIKPFRTVSEGYVANLPVFCKIEHNMSLKARIPVRIRLGSVDYVNYLEGKHKK